MTASKRSVCQVWLSVPGVTRRSGTDQYINILFDCFFVSGLLNIILIFASFGADFRAWNLLRK